jgi:hypothetical protein
MGEAQSNSWEPGFNRSIKVSFDDQRISSHGGVLLIRDIDHELGITESITSGMFDSRDPERIRYTLIELLRERLYAMSVGFSNHDDLDRLAHDPAFRMAVWDRPGEKVLDERLASQPTQSRLVNLLAWDKRNLNRLREGLSESVTRHVQANGKGRAVMRGTIDIDSFPIEVHGQQEGGNYNGYYRKTTYHPLVASFCVAGDYDSGREGHRLGNGFIHAILRQGSVHTAAGAKRFIGSVMEKSKQLARTIDFRIDAGYTSGEIMDALSDANLKFVGRLRRNSKLEALAARHVKRPSGRPPREGYEYIVELGKYQADSWRHAQRLILVVIDRPDPVTGQLKLFPDYFFLVTNWSERQRKADNLLGYYRKRGTFEDRLGEFNQAIGVHLSSQPFAKNEATMLLAMLAYNLASIARNELEDAVGGCWDLRRFQTYVLQAGARITKHARRLIVHVAQSVEDFWMQLRDCISRWKLPDRFRPPRGPRPRAWRPPPAHAHRQEVLRS